jgi:hypothetical protein
MSLKLVGQRLQLVTGLDGDLLGQVTAADAGGARPQRLDRADHAAGEKHPGQNGNGESGQQHQGEPLQGGVKRRIGLLGRQLDEHQPAERRHRRIGGEHFVSFDVLAFLHRPRGAVR